MSDNELFGVLLVALSGDPARRCQKRCRRLDDGGASDSTPGDKFGADGTVIGGEFGASAGTDIALQGDGKIVVVAEMPFTPFYLPRGSTSFLVARYDADGLLDTSFGGGGEASIPGERRMRWARSCSSRCVRTWNTRASKSAPARLSMPRLSAPHPPPRTRTRAAIRTCTRPRKRNQWYFGMKAHIGVDSQTKLIHAVAATPANVHDSVCLPDLLHGEETRVWGDSAYQGQSEVLHLCFRDIVAIDMG